MDTEGFRPGAGGAGGPGRWAAHLHDTVISTLVAGMLPAKESNSLSDAMSSGCSIAHCPPHPTPPQISQYSCAIHASSGAAGALGWAARGGKEREEGAWEVRAGRGRRAGAAEKRGAGAAAGRREPRRGSRGAAGREARRGRGGSGG